MKKYHIFDMDGTLADSMPVFAQNLLSLLKNSGVEYPENIIQILTPMGGLLGAEYLVKLGAAKSVNEVIEFTNGIADKAYGDQIELKPFAKDYIEYLYKNGCKLYALSASAQKHIKMCFKRNGIIDNFSEIYSSDAFSLPKSNTEIYLKLTDSIGCSPQDAVFYDDNISAVKAAKKAGLFTVGVYDISSSDCEEQMRKVADKYIKSFKELI